MDEKEDTNRRVKMSLLTKIVGAVVLIGVTFTTCSCNSDKEYSRTLSPEDYFRLIDYPSHMQLTIYDPLPPKSGISNN